MRFFVIDLLANADPKFYFTNKRPKGLGISTWQMAEGVAIGDKWPEKLPAISPSEDSPGTKLPDLIGSTTGYLITSKRLCAVIREHCTTLPIEYLPISLLDHKGRAITDEYCLINPIGPRDALNHARSSIKYTADKKVVAVKKHVLDPRKLTGAPALFRVKENPHEYFVAEPLARALAGKGFTNILLTEVETSSSDEQP